MIEMHFNSQETSTNVSAKESAKANRKKRFLEHLDSLGVGDYESKDEEIPVSNCEKKNDTTFAVLSDDGRPSHSYENSRIRKDFDGSFNGGSDPEMESAEGDKDREARGDRGGTVEKALLTELPMDWESVFGESPVTGQIHASKPSDGLILSLSNLGRVDIEYISSITGFSLKDVIVSLKGSIYQNPLTWDECFYKGWETSEEYLSGNLRRKYKLAKEANERYHGYFKENLKALESVMPPLLSSDEIYVTLGSSWVPEDIIEDFMRHIFADSASFRHYSDSSVNPIVFHNETLGEWRLDLDPYAFPFARSLDQTYGTKRMRGFEVLERTLSSRPIAIYKTTQVFDPKTRKLKEKRVLDEEETLRAQECQKRMMQEFRNWIFRENGRKKRLIDIYEDRFACNRRRIFDGSFLNFPGLADGVELRPYQKNAVARILFSPNTLLAHEVGSGKTFVMAAAGMELRRMGLSKKNLYVVSNNILGQWRSTFSSLYPEAKLLAVEPSSFTPSKRIEVLKEIRDGSYDAILMAYSSFDLIPLSKGFLLEQLNKEKREIQKSLQNSSYLFQTSANSLLKRIEQEKKKLIQAPLKGFEGVCFDELGINRLFVDEAHNYKNIPIASKARHILGINMTGSRKCEQMLLKTRCVQRQNGGGGVIFATGTPITNSVSDAYVLQLYLQNGELALLKLNSFDSWAATFAEKTTGFEVDVDTSTYRMATRFSCFRNLPELACLLAGFSDFHSLDQSDGIPEIDGYTDCLVPKSPDFSLYLSEISRRADSVRGGEVPPEEDNMLKITTDGRKAALDMRLIDFLIPPSLNGKIACCAKNVAEIYFKTAEERSTQLVFCDTSTPKVGFNLYDELKALLLKAGLPKESIAYVHEATTDSAKEKLFSKVRKGEIRVLLGSTFKLGLGVNVQNRLIALHHLDVPWRPADMVQREGRILRQGNLNPKVRIFRYITEGSFDAYSWQLLETKQRFISELLGGSLASREGGDVESTVLNYAEVKALAVGNPIIKERVEKSNELSRLLILQKKESEARAAMETRLLELPSLIGKQETIVANCQQDCDFLLAQADSECDKEAGKAMRERLKVALLGNGLQAEETLFGEYKGFSILLPSSMVPEKPTVYLSRAGRYSVELGDSERGYFPRIDNCLKDLPNRLQRLTFALGQLRDEETGIREALVQPEAYAARIEACRERLKRIDKKLGVTQQ